MVSNNDNIELRYVKQELVGRQIGQRKRLLKAQLKNSRADEFARDIDIAEVQRAIDQG